MSASPRRLAITGQFQLAISIVFVAIGVVLVHDYLLRLILVMVGIVNFVLGILMIVRGFKMMKRKVDQPRPWKCKRMPIVVCTMLP